jgi:hypothetical protein
VLRRHGPAGGALGGAMLGRPAPGACLPGASVANRISSAPPRAPLRLHRTAAATARARAQPGPPSPPPGLPP